LTIPTLNELMMKRSAFPCLIPFRNNHQQIVKRRSPGQFAGLLLVFFLLSVQAQAQEFMPASKLPPKYLPDTRVDNMGYWQRLAELGLVPVQARIRAARPVQKSSVLMAPGLLSGDSPDIPVTETYSLQSENSIFADPSDPDQLLNSNNSHPAPYIGSQYGADALTSADGGQNWEGTVQGAGGYNFGDPATAISRSGRRYIGFIFSGGGQGISYSDDQGQSWHKRAVASAPSGFGSLLDKNHLWVDNSLTSPHEGNLYDGWTVIGSGAGSGQLQVSRSTDGGLAWQMPVQISTAVAAGSHNQGINLSTGPLGEVYAVWAVYDSWPGNENALGFARSLNGGQSWEPAKRIHNDIKGIRIQGVNKLMRVNSFPVMAVDNSNGPDRGSLYVVWANFGVPGINAGPGVDVYFMKSTDRGQTWSVPARVNQDPVGNGREHFFPWISCDPDNGNLAVVFYDDRNVGDEQCETWVAVSKNGGASWQDFRVSDVTFTPQPLTNTSDNYFGDYLGIAAKNGMVYPCWTDNRTGEAMGYVSPFRLGPKPGQPFVEYYLHQVNDTLTGNSNSICESGETFSLALRMRNNGDQPDTALSVKLSCNSPWVQILKDTEFFGDFGIGEIKSLPAAFQIRFSDSIPDGIEIPFTLQATDQNDSIRVSQFLLIPQAPRLTPGPLYIDDSDGNGNHQLDPGEAVRLFSILTNTGNYPVQQAVCRLSTQQPFCQITTPEAVSGPLQPGESDTLSWLMTVSAGIPAGTSAGFTDSLFYSGRQDQRLFLKKIGVVTEDWESGTMNQMAWKTGGNKPWNLNNFKVFEGLYSLRSGYISSLDTSYFSIRLNLVADDSISFYRKVSSELNYDFLNFYIDGMKVGQWSGEKDWARVSFPLTGGIHTLRWEYIKDNGLSSGNDAAWIDFIQFPVQQLATAWAGPDAEVCAGSPFHAESEATFYRSLAWSSTGSGIFNDPTVFNPVYYPSPADAEAGTVLLILTLTGYSYAEIIRDTMLLSIATPATAFAGPDALLCTGDLFATAASASNYSAVHWSTVGDGHFQHADSLNTLFLPGKDDLHQGHTLLILTAQPLSGSCSAVSDTMHLDVLAGFTADFTGDTTICRGDTAFLRVKLTGQGPWRIYMHSGASFGVQSQTSLFPVTPPETTLFTIDSISNLNGCVSRTVRTVNVNVLQPPSVIMEGPAGACSGNRIILQAESDTSAVSWAWSPEAGDKSFINPMISGKAGDEYQFLVRVTGRNGCSVTDSLVGHILTGCEQQYAGNMQVQIYPNPTTGRLTLGLSSVTEENARVIITATDNKQIYLAENIAVIGVKPVSIDLSAFGQGTYQLKVSCGSGEYSGGIIVAR
jgi:hypothetical protein